MVKRIDSSINLDIDSYTMLKEIARFTDKNSAAIAEKLDGRQFYYVNKCLRVGLDVYTKYRIPDSLEHARHQLRFLKKRTAKTDDEVSRGWAKYRESSFLRRKKIELQKKS